MLNNAKKRPFSTGTTCLMILIVFVDIVNPGEPQLSTYILTTAIGLGAGLFQILGI